MILSLIFLVAALVLFVIAALPLATPRYPALVAAGLACWVLAELLKVVPL